MKKKLRIMQIIPNLGIGGAETFVTQLISSFDESVEKILVSLYKNEDTSLDRRLKENSINVIYFDKKKGIDLKTVRRLRKLIKEWKPDVINTHLYSLTYAVIATRWMRHKPLIFHTVHNIASKEATEKKQKLYNYFFHHYKVYPVGISNIIKKSIEQRYHLNNVDSIDNGIDYNRFKGELDISSRKYDLIHVGRFTYQKNHELLIKAFKIVSEKIDAHLYLVGQGELLDKTKELIASLELNDRVTILGLRSDVEDIMKNAKMFILPSRYEGNPLTLLEAMSAGCVCIATPVGGIPDILENKVNGYLVEGNEILLSERIIRTYLDKAKMQEISSRNIEYALKFDIKEVARRYVELYETKLKSTSKK